MRLALPWWRAQTFGAAADAYLSEVRHLSSWMSRRAEVRAWLAALGPDTRIDRITRADVVRVRGIWLGRVAPQTANHRLRTLDHLMRTVAPDLASPCRGVRPVAVPRTVPRPVPAELIERVDAALAAAYRAGRLPTERARARFAVAATTGRRPSEIMRTRPEDIDWTCSIWRVRDGKGGWTPGGIYLAVSARRAWELFRAADAWGPFFPAAWVRTLRLRGGWPADRRPYELRHSVGIAMSEAGIDLADVGAALGHTDPAMTRSHYVPVLRGRMQAAAEALEAARPIAIARAEGAHQLALPLLAAAPAPGRLGSRALGLHTQEPGNRGPQAVDPGYRPTLRLAAGGTGR